MIKLETCLQSFQEKNTPQASDVIIFFQVPAQSNLRIAEFYEPRASTITFLPVHVDGNRKYSRASGAVKVKYTGKPEGREAFRTQVLGCDPRWRVDKMTFELSRPSNPGDPYSAVVIVSTVPASDEILAKVAPIKKAFYAAGDYILLLVGDDPAAVEQFTTSNKIRHVLQVSSIEDEGITEFIYNCAITINQGVPATKMSTPRK